MTASDDARDTARVLMTIFDVFRDEKSEMTIQLAHTFLLIMYEEGLGVTEYANKADMSQSVMSRHIADLGEYNRRHQPGLNLVAQKVDVMDRRRTIVVLSPRGKTVAQRLGRALAGRR